jgi:hypothetical protein
VGNEKDVRVRVGVRELEERGKIGWGMRKVKGLGVG